MASDHLINHPPVRKSSINTLLSVTNNTMMNVLVQPPQEPRQELPRVVHPGVRPPGCGREESVFIWLPTLAIFWSAYQGDSNWVHLT